MKNKKVHILKVILSEWPTALGYLLLLLLLSLVCLLYHVDLNVISDLARYTVLPFLIFLGVRVYQKEMDVETMSRLIESGDFGSRHLHGFYGKLYEKTVRELIKQESAEKQELLASLKNREDYLTLWSHEMKTPLTSLLMMAEDAPAAPSEEVSEKIDLVNYQLRQLLTFDRLADFNHDLVFEKIDLLTCLKQVIQQNVSFFLSREVTPQLKVPAATILTDSKWFSFVLEQLLTNAVKYSHKKSTIQINFEAGALTIHDHGIRIAKSDLPRVFDQGFTGSNGRTHGEATGMGLYMAQRIATILDIKLVITSVENVGTTVKLIFNPKKLQTK